MAVHAEAWYIAAQSAQMPGEGIDTVCFGAPFLTEGIWL